MNIGRGNNQLYILFLLLISCLVYWKLNNGTTLHEHLQTGFYFLTRIPAGDIYIYSAIGSLGRDSGNITSVTLNVWDGSQNKKFGCCLFRNGQKINPYQVAAYIKNNYGYSTLVARQYRCYIPRSMTNVTDLGLVEKGNVCSTTMLTVPIINAERNENSFAICTKIAYNKLSPQRLIEWFEYQRLMGVDKVLVMVQYLNDDAYKVLKYYKTLGLLDIDSFPSPLPGNVSAHPNRGFEEYRFALPQSTHDEQVGLYHCQEKLNGYQYVGVIDFDEYVVHDDLLTYRDILQKELLPKYPKAAGFTFNVSFFILDWNETGSGDLYLTRYLSRAEPRSECNKNFYIPKRVKGVTTHRFQPISGYKRYELTNHNVILHHYRKCPGIPKWKNCMTIPRITDYKMHKIRTEMSDRVSKVKNELML